MTNATVNTNNNTVASNNNNYVVSGLTQEQLEAILAAAGAQAKISAAPMKKVKIVDNFEYVDETKTEFICRNCGETHKVAEIPADKLDECRKLGMDAACMASYNSFLQVQAKLKQAKISASGGKIIVNGGEEVGKRLKIAFADVLKSEQLTPEIIGKLCDTGFSHDALKFSSYPFLIDVTDVTPEEMKADSTYKRFYAQKYQIFGRTYRMCAQIYKQQFTATIAAFKNLGLIDADAEY